jgi:hypothetical protein
MCVEFTKVLPAEGYDGLTLRSILYSLPPVNDPHFKLLRRIV